MGNVQTLSNKFGCAKWIVDPNAASGTHTTATAANASASAGDTIFFKPGTYTENWSPTPGVNYACYETDGIIGNVIFKGKISISTAGTFTFSGMQFQTNSDFALAVTGSAASNVILNDCYINCTNNTGVSYTSSSASSSITLKNCQKDLGTTGISYWTSTGAGTLSVLYSQCTNTGNSTTSSNNSAGKVEIEHSSLMAPTSSSGTGQYDVKWTNLNMNAIAVPGYTNNSSSPNVFFAQTTMTSGSGICVVNNGTITFRNVNMTTSNSVAISGSGTSIITLLGLAGGVNSVTSAFSAANVISGAISFDGGTNYLDNYAEGTWTPTVQTANGNMTGISYTIQQGHYTRIGNTIHLRCTVSYTAIVAGTGSLQVQSLPFTSANIANLNAYGSCIIEGPVIAAAAQGLCAHINPNASVANFLYSQTATGFNSVSTTASATLFFSITYQV